MTGVRRVRGTRPAAGPGPGHGTGRAERAWAGVSGWEIAAVLGAALVLVGSWVVATQRERVPDAERAVFHAVNRLPDALEWALWPVMQLGNLLGAVAVAVVVAVLSRDWRPTLAVVLAAQAAWWLAKVVKDLVDRGRPEALLPDALLREHDAGLGFVSGHAAVACAVATVLVPMLPRAGRATVVALAAFVGLARVYFGAHLPLDVVGGAGLGIIVGSAVSWVLVRPWRPLPPRRAPARSRRNRSPSPPRAR
jgi:glycosyltransferase 2 family protein